VQTEVRRIADQYQFFHWHLAFPDVFVLPKEAGKAENEQTGWSRGFNVVLGNPPWERVKLQEKEWFAQRVPEISNAATAAERKRLIRSLTSEEPRIWGDFLDAKREAEGVSHFVRQSQRFPLCGSGDLNTFAVFAELSRENIAPNGTSGLILPLGIATDNPTKAFFSDLVRSQSLIQVFGFINEDLLFKDVLHNFKFCIFVIGGSLASVSSPLFVFNAYNVSEAQDAERQFTLSLEELQLMNPDTETCPTFFWRRSAELTKSIYRNSSYLGSDLTKNGGWNVSFGSMLHMSSESKYFLAEPEIDSVAVYESKMLNQYNHRYASYHTLAVGKRSHMLPVVDIGDLEDAFFSVVPCYFIPEGRLGVYKNTRWLIATRRIASAGLVRTAACAVLPRVGAGNSINTALLRHTDINHTLAFVALFNSFPFDFCVRQKQAGANLSFFVLNQLPVFNANVLTTTLPGAARHNWLKWIASRALELTYTAWDLKSFALDCNYDGPPFHWDEERRFLLRCELDAAYFHLYLGPPAEWGTDSPQLREMFPTPRDAVDYILETFPIVKRKDIARTAVKNTKGEVIQEGTYITKETILTIYDEMQQAIDTGQPYQTKLNPPPGPPTDAEGNFLPMSQWAANNWPSHIHAPKEMS